MLTTSFHHYCPRVRSNQFRVDGFDYMDIFFDHTSTRSDVPYLRSLVMSEVNTYKKLSHLFIWRLSCVVRIGTDLSNKAINWTWFCLHEKAVMIDMCHNTSEAIQMQTPIENKVNILANLLQIRRITVTDTLNWAYYFKMHLEITEKKTIWLVRSPELASHWSRVTQDIKLIHTQFFSVLKRITTS